jgi:hypothetical protein
MADMRPWGHQPGRMTCRRPSAGRHAQHTCPSTPAAEQRGPIHHRHSRSRIPRPEAVLAAQARLAS